MLRKKIEDLLSLCFFQQYIPRIWPHLNRRRSLAHVALMASRCRRRAADDSTPTNRWTLPALALVPLPCRQAVQAGHEHIWTV